MGIAAVAAMLPEPAEPAPLPEAKVVRPLTFPVVGGAALKPRPELAAEPDDFEYLHRINQLRRSESGLRLVPMEEAGGDD
jgi:hypothetical protein